MLTAIDQSGERFVLLKTHTSAELRKIREVNCFYCEVCGDSVILKVGERVTAHFAHKPNARCEGENEPESTIHREGKWGLYQWLKNHGELPVVEEYFAAIRQRADIGLPQRERPIVIEYQCSQLTPKRYRERNNGYKKLNIFPFWILGANRLDRRGKYIYKWAQTDQLMLPSTINRPTPYLIFFDGRTEAFTVLSHFWSLNISTVIADRLTIPAGDLCISQLFSPPLPKENTDAKQMTWLKQKEKWRTFRPPHQGKLERYVQTICARNNISLSFFPPYVGLPLKDQIDIASSSYLWQAWLVLQFLYQRPKGTVLYVKTIEKAFQRLVDKGIITLRQDKNFMRSLEHYFLALEQFSLIKKGINNEYIIENMVKWETKSLSNLLQDDASYLWRWIELNI